MDTLWPWLVVAGAGCLHGLHPASGWMFAAAWGVRAGDRGQALRALLPIAAGHALSVVLTGAAVALGLSMNRGLLQILAGALLLMVVALHLLRRTVRTPTSYLGLALWSFMMGSAHGAGLMLVPALMPLCVGGDTLSAPLAMALAAVSVHTLAMLATTGLVASGACRAVAACARRRAIP